jgi:hypothetical protein
MVHFGTLPSKFGRRLKPPQRVSCAAYVVAAYAVYLGHGIWVEELASYLEQQTRWP